MKGVTAPDLLRFVQALEGGRLIGEPHASRYRGRGLGGGAPGVNTMLEMNVAGDHTVIVLSNLLQRRIVTVPAGEKYVGMDYQLFDGTLPGARYFRYISDRKLVGFTVSMSDDGLMLDSLSSPPEFVLPPE